MTEEASKLRANAASSIVQLELELIEIERELRTFKIESKESKLLHKIELKRILKIGNNISNIAQELKSIIPLTCSAVSATLYPSNCSDKLTSMIRILDEVINELVEAELKLRKFKLIDNKENIENNKKILDSILSNVVKAKNGINSILKQLHELLFV